MTKGIAAAIAGAFLLGWATGYANAAWIWVSNMKAYSYEVRV